VSRPQITLLLSSAGRRVELLRCFRREAAWLGIDLRVLATDYAPDWSAACHEADASFAIPLCISPTFVHELLGLCRRERVDLLVPTIDPELSALSAHIEAFRTSGTEVVISGPDVVRIARDKLATARHLAAAGIPVPKTALPDEVEISGWDWTWPLLVKPRDGSGSTGILKVESRDQLAPFLGSEDHVVQTLMTGVEYTVNVFFDRAGVLHCAVPHQRYEIRAGEVAKGVTERVPGLWRIAQALGRSLPGACGPLCFQAFMAEDGRMAVFEINARFGGGYPLAHQAGAPFTRWLLEEAIGAPLTAHDDWRAGVRMLRYDAAVFPDEPAEAGTV